jgi:Xaa-Pro aminopeptidase
MSQSLAERDRRWELLNESMRNTGVDALIFAANDYRGHKGSLRYVADYNLFHRSGNAVMFAGEEPSLILSGNLAGARRPKSAWVSEYRFPGTISQGLIDAFEGRSNVDRVGIVGMGQVMKVDEYLALSHAYPQIEFSDYSAEFERIRSVKSPAEIVGAEESAFILDECFTRLLEIVRPGVTEREIAAEMHKVGHRLGGEDPLFLTMYSETQDDKVSASFAPARDRELAPHDIFTFSFEIVGPKGYWTELSRMVTFAPPRDDDARMAQASANGIAAGARQMKEGALPGDVQRAVLDAIERHGATSSYWSGHSLGLDVLEQPWIGLDVVEDGEGAEEIPLQVGNVLTLHPMVLDQTAKVSGYMADTFIVEEAGSRKLSEHPTGLYRLTKGEVQISELAEDTV